MRRRWWRWGPGLGGRVSRPLQHARYPPSLASHTAPPAPFPSSPPFPPTTGWTRRVWHLFTLRCVWLEARRRGPGRRGRPALCPPPPRPPSTSAAPALSKKTQPPSFFFFLNVTGLARRRPRHPRPRRCGRVPGPGRRRERVVRGGNGGRGRTRVRACVSSWAVFPVFSPLRSFFLPPPTPPPPPPPPPKNEKNR